MQTHVAAVVTHTATISCSNPPSCIPQCCGSQTLVVLNHKSARKYSALLPLSTPCLRVPAKPSDHPSTTINILRAFCPPAALWLPNAQAQAAVVGRFRSGELNVLIATNVGNEGMDFQQCELVVAFEPPTDVTQYTQVSR